VVVAERRKALARLTCKSLGTKRINREEKAEERAHLTIEKVRASLFLLLC
jgi:hypothetical protein